MGIRRRSSLLLALATVVLLGCPGDALAATITPDTSDDELSNDSDCSLREAITLANTDSTAAEDSCPLSGVLGDDTVVLGASDYVLTVAGAGANNATGDLNASTALNNLTIDGAGVGATTIDTDDSPPWDDRVLRSTGAYTLRIRDLTITGGASADGEGGGGIRNEGVGGVLDLERVRVTGNSTDAAGGGVRGRIAISDSVIDTNDAATEAGGILAEGLSTIDSTVIRDNSVNAATARGGGISTGSSLDLTISDSVIADNIANGTGAGSAAGGGLAAWAAPATTTIRRSTISGNRATAAMAGSARRSGGIDVLSGTVNLVNSTVSGNEALTASGEAGGISALGAYLNLVHTTIGPNPSGDDPASLQTSSSFLVNARGSVISTVPGFDACDLGVTSQGYNVGRDATCGLTGTGDQQGVGLGFGALADNGGPDAGAPDFLEAIETHLPAGDSPATDRVPAGDCDDELLAPLLTDQRGLPRPVDDNGDGLPECEAGAIELQTPVLANPPAPLPADTATKKKKCKKKRKKKGKRAAAGKKKKCKKKRKKKS